MKRKRLAALILAAAMALQGIADVSPAAAAEVLGEEVLEGTEAVLPGIEEVIYEKTSFENTDDLECLAGNGGNGGNRQPIYSSDQMSFDGGSAHKVIVKAEEAQNLTDFVYEADLSVTERGTDNNTSQAGLLFRVTEAQPNMSDGYKGYYFGIDPQAQQVILGKANGSKWTEIATKKMTLEFGKFYHATVAVSGNLITAYIDYDGEHYAKISATDDEFASGSIGTRHWISAAVWKNLKVSAYHPAAVSPEDAYMNPLLNMCADPDVLYHNGTYFLYPTNAGDANDDEGIKVYTSTDLVHWTEQGFAFRKGDGWGTGNFWAPDTIERDGVFYMYYTANEQICVAESDSPLGPYKQTVMEPMHSNVKEIDAHVFYDEASDKYYMYFVRFTDGNVIYGAELNDDMKSIKEDTIKELLKANQGWDQDMAKVNEGPFMLTRDSKYYLTYSGSHFQSIQYGSAYAVSDSPLGNYVKYENNPIMKSNSLAHGTGHHCVIESPDGSEMYMVYHSHHDLNNTEPRQLCIDRMQFTTDAKGNTVLEVNGPTVTPQKLPSGSVDVDNFIEFDKAELETVRVEAGTDKEQLKAALPAELTVKASKSSDKKASVEWNLDDYTPDSSQDVVTITGTAELPQGIANLKEASLEVEINVMSADLPDFPDMQVKVGGEAFAEFDQETSQYDIRIEDIKNIPDVAVEIAAGDQQKFKASVIQASAKSRRAYIVITSPLDASYRKEYTIRFRGPIGLMQKIEAEDAVCTGIAKPRNESAASNGQVVGNIDNAADTVTFELEAPEDGTYRIGLGVYNPQVWPSASHRYWVNGKEDEAQMIVYPKKGGTVEVGVEVELKKGDNTFTVSHVDGDRTFAELDYIIFYAVTLKQERSQKIEAETAEVTGKAKVNDQSAASGGKLVGGIDDADSTVTFELEAPEDGTYKIGLGVYNPKAWTNAAHRYWVNGEESGAQTISYPQIGGCTVETCVEVELKKGANTFTVSHAEGEKTFAELDYIVFYTADQKMEISVGNDAIAGFDVDTADYEADVRNLSSLPEVSVTFAEEVKDYFKTEITQASADRPEAYIRITSPLDQEYVKEYRIRFCGPDTFQNPLINFGADPYVTYQNGYYYYVRVKNDRSIWVTRSAELGRIGQAEPKKVYEPADGEPDVELWAPEIHFLNGKWYIYYTAGAGSNHRMYALECDEAQGTYTWKGKLAPATDKWAIDQTVLEHDGQLYAVWSGWHYDQDIDQRIYIARMENPWTITGERVELSMPEYDWECIGNPTVNEGPQVVKAPDGTVNIVYSASGSWSDDYCLGCLTLKEDADPMDADSWIKADKAIFSKNGSTTFSTGHASFVPSPDGTEDYVVYHATRHSGDGWNGRGVRAQRVYWNEDGTPDIGAAIGYDSRVNMPSGTKKAVYTRYEAENAELKGSCSVTGTYNSSGGKKAGLNAADDSAVFHVTAAEAGDYKLYLGAAAGKENAALSVKVNDETAVVKEIVNFNASAAARICVDNWFGYELKVALKSGENTITVSGADGKAGADLDYIELCSWEEAEAPNPGVDIPEEPKDAKAPVITKQPEGKSYIVGDTAAALTVTAKTEDEGTLSYQWYQNSSNSTEGAEAISGAVKSSYVPSTEKTGIVYYYCKVTNTNTEVTGTQTAAVNSRVVSITVREEGTELVDAATPVITKQPEQASYTVNQKAEALTVTASVEDEGTLSYQWYQNSSNSTEGAAAIAGAVKSAYVPSTEKAGTIYYYCEVTNTNTAVSGTQTAVKDSRVVSVTVKEEPKPVDAGVPVITKQPEQASYTVNQKAGALTVTASVEDEGTLSYQWYQNSSNSTEGAAAIAGAIKAAYVPSTEKAGTTYYYCEVTNTNAAATGTKTAVTNSHIVSVTVTVAGTEPGTDPDTKPGTDPDTKPVNAAAPVITKQPEQAAYTYKQSAQPLTVTAEVSDGGTVSYQWYRNGSNRTEGAAAIQGAVNRSYTPSTEAIGTVYYYCAVTNTNAAATGTKTAVTNSNPVPIAVDKAENPIMGISSYSKAIGSKLTLKPAGTAAYKTSNKKVVTVTSKGKVTFKGIGKATITVNAKGNAYYKAAVKKISFTVTPKTMQMKSVKSSKSKMIAVKWKKDTKVSGYEIQYAVNKNFKGAKTKKIKKNSTTSWTFKKLKGGKKYYIRMRSYKTVSKKPIYSSWSKVKSVKVKK